MITKGLLESIKQSNDYLLEFLKEREKCIQSIRNTQLKIERKHRFCRILLKYKISILLRMDELADELRKLNIDNCCDIDSFLRKFNEIYKDDVEPSEVKHEMCKLLQEVNSVFSNHLRQLIEIQDGLDSFLQNPKNKKYLKGSIASSLKKMRQAVCGCQDRYYKNLSCLHELYDYFSEPQESPPRL